ISFVVSSRQGCILCSVSIGGWAFVEWREWRLCLCMVYTVVLESDRVNAEVVRTILSRLSVRPAGHGTRCCSGYYVHPKRSHVLSVHTQWPPAFKQ
ncbi:hypothetical protein EV363DRAFT_1176441, partial [Boletus edulis]